MDEEASLDAAVETSAVMSGTVVVRSRLPITERDAEVDKVLDAASEVKLGTTKVDEDSVGAVDRL